MTSSATFSSSSSPSFSTRTHIRSDLLPNAGRNLQRLRQMVSSRKPALYNKYKDIFVNDAELNRFLVAKSSVSKKGENAGAIEYNLEASSKLMCDALEWRDKKQLDFIESEKGWQKEMEREGCTGKIYIPDNDRYGRPVLIFDDGAQNTDDMNGQLRYLAWCLNLACRFMNPSEVDKYVVFINLEKFSIFTCPSMQTSKETINMLCNMFPERMGHCIAYKGPVYFTTFFNIVKPLIDPKTVSKIQFVNGDVSDGTENDMLLRNIIGDNWKEITGATSEVISKDSSPGYNHATYWPALMERVRITQEKESKERSVRSYNNHEGNRNGHDDDDHSEFKYSVPRSALTSSISTPHLSNPAWNTTMYPSTSHATSVYVTEAKGPHTPDMPRPPENRFRTRGVKLSAKDTSNSRVHNSDIGASDGGNDLWIYAQLPRKRTVVETIWDLIPSFDLFIFVYMLTLLLVVVTILDGNALSARFGVMSDQGGA